MAKAVAQMTLNEIKATLIESLGKVPTGSRASQPASESLQRRLSDLLGGERVSGTFTDRGDTLRIYEYTDLQSLTAEACHTYYRNGLNLLIKVDGNVNDKAFIDWQDSTLRALGYTEKTRRRPIAVDPKLAATAHAVAAGTLTLAEIQAYNAKQDKARQDRKDSQSLAARIQARHAARRNGSVKTVKATRKPEPTVASVLAGMTTVANGKSAVTA